MRGLYNVLLYLLLPLLPLRLLWRGLHAPAYRRRWGERFGFFPPLPQGCIWLHAVSLGETLAAAPLIRALRQRHPHTPLLLTHMTPTGLERGRALFGEAVTQVYLPYDYPLAARRFLDAAQPRLGILMETELWPNLLRQCARRELPLLLVNARLSARSARRYGYAPGFSRELLGDLSLIAAQTEADAARFIGLGAAPGRVRVSGNLKFDLDLPPGLSETAAALRQVWGERSVWVAASTHAGEDEVVLQAHAELRAEFPALLLILVPRHPERFEAVAALCRAHGFAPARRSQGQTGDGATAVYLGDTLGELLLLYAAADLALVGGSLIPRGGHNPLEPAALGLPVLFGPHVFNFTEVSRRLLETGAARQLAQANPAVLAAAVAVYLRDPELRRHDGERGRAFVSANRGALARLLEWVEACLGG